MAKVGSEIDQLEIIRNTIDVQYIQTKKFYIRQFFLWTLTFYLPLAYLFMKPGEVKEPIPWAISIISMLYFFYQEIVKIADGKREYFKIFENVYNFGTFFIFIYVTLYRLINYNIQLD